MRLIDSKNIGEFYYELTNDSNAGNLFLRVIWKIKQFFRNRADKAFNSKSRCFLLIDLQQLKYSNKRNVKIRYYDKKGSLLQGTFKIHWKRGDCYITPLKRKTVLCKPLKGPMTFKKVNPYGLTRRCFIFYKIMGWKVPFRNTL